MLVIVAKLLVKLPAVPAVRSSALVLPVPVIHVTRTLSLSRAMVVMRKAEALLVASVPARNSAKLFCPSPSGSAVGAALGQVTQLKYWTCHKSGRPSALPSGLNATGTHAENSDVLLFVSVAVAV